jgi:undecaprenyl diphosphate synthase
VAIIMDGNGRWAKMRSLPRIEGHKAGALSVRRTVEEARRLGIRYLTLYSFSTENWRRAPEEIEGLMGLLRQYLDSELEGLLKNGVRLRAIGDLARLPLLVRHTLERNIERTSKNTGLDLILALSYGSRQEIVGAARTLALRAQRGELSADDITEDSFASALFTAGMPDPDLLIRTSGEMRVSNFLLWQIAYAEIWVTDVLWPDFRRRHLLQAIADFQKRERRYGGITAATSRA